MVRNNHLDHIDFIKGLAAISVILLHTLPINVLYGSFAVYHIWQAVPFFLFITFYLGFRNLDKKEDVFRDYYSKSRTKKILLKLWFPLIILAALEALLFIAFGNKVKAIGSFLCYANGPGSYYIWIYMQIWLLIPLIYSMLRKLGTLMGGGILLIISTIGDFIVESSLGVTPGFICFRYLFLSIPAYIYLKGVKLKKTAFFIILSIIYLFLINYSVLPKYIDPLLPNGWEAQTSLGFFYTLLLFVMLAKFYERIKSNQISKYITHIGTISWEVFIVQMVLLGSGLVDFISLKLFQSVCMQVCFKVIITLLISLITAELYKKLINALITVNK